MPDILVGSPISAEDLPPALWAEDSTGNTNITSLTYIDGSPIVSVTFTAPTSGAVMVSVGIAAGDNGGSNRVHLTPEIRETDAAGAVVLAANVGANGVGTPGEITQHTYRSRTSIVTGLTPGATYYAHAVHRVSGGTTADISHRNLTVCPVPLGGARAGQLVRALDFPPAGWAQDATAINNPSNSSYIAGVPEVGVTFMAPTSGRVLLIVGGGAGSSAGADRIFLSPEVRETDASGAVVLTPSVTSRGWSSDMSSAGQTYGSRESVLEGLTPGGIYHARCMYVVATIDPGGSTADITFRDIGVVPLP